MENKINKMVAKKDVKKLLDFLINDREMISKIKFNQWNEMHQTISTVTDIIEDELKDWKGSQKFVVKGVEILYKLRKQTEDFIKLCEDRQKLNKGWKGTTGDCADAFDNYRKDTIPLILTISSHLESDNNLRLEIEEKLREHNYPVLS